MNKNEPHWRSNLVCAIRDERLRGLILKVWDRLPARARWSIGVAKTTCVEVDHNGRDGTFGWATEAHYDDGSWGTVVALTQLVKRTPDAEALIAHELAHVVCRHYRNPDISNYDMDIEAEDLVAEWGFYDDQ